MPYKIIRFYHSAGVRRRTIERGLTLAEVQAHCKDPETSSRTATNAAARRRTQELGPWFDGYEQD